MKIENWLLNVFMFVFVGLVHFCYLLYKENRAKDKKLKQVENALKYYIEKDEKN